MNAAVLVGLRYPNLTAFSRNDSHANVDAVRKALCAKSTSAVTLVDSSATAVTCEAVRAAIQSMIRSSKSSDQLLVYFSGVGGCVDDFFGDAGDDQGGNEFLRFSDGLLFAKELSELVQQVPIDVTLTIALDCTTSDGITSLHIPKSGASIHFSSGTSTSGSADPSFPPRLGVSPWTSSWIESGRLEPTSSLKVGQGVAVVKNVAAVAW